MPPPPTILTDEARVGEHADIDHPGKSRGVHKFDGQPVFLAQLASVGDEKRPVAETRAVGPLEGGRGLGRGRASENPEGQADDDGAGSAARQECAPVDRARDRSGAGIATVMVTHDVPSAVLFAIETSNFYAK